MITEVYFTEGFCLYTQVGSSGRGVLDSSNGITGTICVVPVLFRRTLQKGAQRALTIGGTIGEDSRYLLRFSIICSFS
jgi:hypothetical protein